MQRTLSFLALAVACLGGSAIEAEAQSVIEADGVIESKSGGFRFPDGSVQTSAASSGGAPVEESGQTSCWDAAGDPVPCTGTGMDGELQMGVTWPTPRFTDNGDGTMLDHLTGLSWLLDAGCFDPVSWAEAFDAVNQLNSGSKSCNSYAAGTHSDWRVPNVKELQSLIDYGRVLPAIAPSNYLINLSFDIYWTSTTSLHDPLYAWVVHLGHGDCYHSGNDGFKAFDAELLPVRGGQ